MIAFSLCEYGSRQNVLGFDQSHYTLQRGWARKHSVKHADAVAEFLQSGALQSSCLLLPVTRERGRAVEGQQEDGMEQRFALPVLAVLVVSTLFGSQTPPVAGDAAKPGTIVTVAGTGSAGYAGDNGPATQARLHQPSGLAFDATGNLYIADVLNNRVRKVGLDGTIATVAGTGQRGFSGDGGKATEAQLNAPARVVLDGEGDLFISDFFNHRVRKVTPDGIISTYAGSGAVDVVTTTGFAAKNGGFSGDSGPATDARLNGPVGLAVDMHGNLYIGDLFNNRVRKVDAATGIITTVAGNGHAGSAGDGGLATEAQLNGSVALAVDSASNLFIADNNDNRVRRVDAITGTITTVAGSGKAGFSGDGGKATDARLNAPEGIAMDSVGNLFVADNSNSRVRMVSPEGIITTVAGNGKTKYVGDGGLATATGLESPNSLAIDAMGNLLIADDDDDRVLKVFGAAAPGLLAGMAFPLTKQP
jgi:sugar lactone lactonase YvrE